MSCAILIDGIVKFLGSLASASQDILHSRIEWSRRGI